MDVATARRIQALALEAITSISAVLNSGLDAEDAETVTLYRRAVGEILAEIDTKLLVALYREFPDMDELK